MIAMNRCAEYEYKLLASFPYKLCVEYNTCSFLLRRSNYHKTRMDFYFYRTIRKTLVKSRVEKVTIIIIIINTIIVIIIKTTMIIFMIMMMMIIINIFIIVISAMMIIIMTIIFTIIKIICIIGIIMIINIVIIIIIIIIIITIIIIILINILLSKFVSEFQSLRYLPEKMCGICCLLTSIADLGLGIHSTCRSYGSKNKWRIGNFRCFKFWHTQYNRKYKDYVYGRC